MPRVLYLALHRPGRSPSQRFRFEQYIEFLKENGFEYDFSYLLSEKDDAAFYSTGNYFNKGLISLKGAWIRLFETFRANEYDIIFIQRECFMLGTGFFEKQFSKSKAKLIFDLDDALWLLNISKANQRFSFLKNPGKTAQIIKFADLIFAGNQYLAEYAKKYNSNVQIVPTTIDTDEYKPPGKSKKKSDKICIGWSGSFTTIPHFEFGIPSFKKIKEKFGNRVEFKIICDHHYQNEELGIQSIKWNRKTEVEEMSEFDIGIMPLPDNEWTKGKCGCKGMVSMALEIPTIMSAVGVNNEIIQDGFNGLLASTENEWIEKLSHLIENQDLRKQLGIQGRKTILQRFSVEALKKVYLRNFSELLNQRI